MQYCTVSHTNADFTSIQQALAAFAPDKPLTIHIAQGIYEEKLFCDRRDTKLIGAGMGKTIIRFADGAKHQHPDGMTVGTFRSYTAFFDGDTLEVRQLTIENAAGDGSIAGQAIAASVHTRYAWFSHVELLSCQDTLFVGPLPLWERQAHGFLGPREHTPRIRSTQYFSRCKIRGDIDFIFGGADAIFEECMLQCRDRGTVPSGYIAAPSTAPDGLGFVFMRCQIRGERAQSFYLARPWRPYGKAAFLQCDMDNCICAAGFDPWGDAANKQTTAFCEYQNTGVGANELRAFGNRLTGTQAAQLLRQAQKQKNRIIKLLQRSAKQMDIRYSANQRDFKRYTTEEVRDEFLIDNLYVPNEVASVYSHVDRMVTLGCMPTTEEVALEKGMDVWKNFGTDFFLERREMGVFNLGGEGQITAGDETFTLGFEDCLYITKGTKTVTFRSKDAANPARFYMVSAPAHKVCKTTFISMAEAQKRPCGQAETANKRVINQFIHPAVLETCQLSMGLTKLEPGSVWNTMPSHTHERRMEIYTYYNIPEGHAVFHMMGEGQQTRHIVMQNYQAVISPSWSIHSGCGTSNYTFIWAMGGENLAFDDMDTIATPELR